MNTHLVLLLVYSAFLVLLGLWIGRLVRSSSKFFVAERTLGPVLLFGTLLAANIGAGSTVGAAGLGYRDGISAWWWVGAAGIGSLFLGLIVGPAIWRVAKRHQLSTVGDFLELRYGPSVRALVACLLWLGTIAILAAQLIALAWVLNVAAGIPKPLGCLLGGVVMTLYFTAGGLLASAWVNLIQVLVMFTGFAVILPFSWVEAGGWQQLAQGTAASGAYADFWAGGDSGWHYLLLLGPAFIVSPGLLQKIFGARDARTVRVGVTLQAGALLLFALVPPLLGMIARLLHPGLDNPELALPTLFMENLPVAVGALGLAAIFSAEVSSADAILFMLATSLSRDLYHRFLNPNADDRTVLKVARFAAIAGGALGVLLAIISPSIISVLTIFYSLLAVSLFVPLTMGLFSRIGGGVEAVSSILPGVLATFSFHILTGGQGIGLIKPVFLGLVVSAAGFFVVAILRSDKNQVK